MELSSHGRCRWSRTMCWQFGERRRQTRRLKTMCFVYSSLATFRPNRYINGNLQKFHVEKNIEINGNFDLVFTTIAAHIHAVHIGLDVSRKC
jgi:hypothetical protein